MTLTVILFIVTDLIDVLLALELIDAFRTLATCENFTPASFKLVAAPLRIQVIAL
jgi:hypothetical protein